jgi:hypothetical protein
MNEDTPPNTGASTPPLLPSAAPSGATPPGESASDQMPIRGLMGAVESILRQPRRLLRQLREGDSGPIIASLLVIATGCGLVYGFVVGTFSGGTQLWAAPLKMALGLLLSALICLPSLYIFSCLAGARARVSDICGLVAGTVALQTVLLLGFAPVAWIFSQSTGSAVAMGGLHVLFWAVATWFGLRFLHHGFRMLDAGTGGLKVWAVMFVLVMLQMSTALRPLVGTAPTLLPVEKKFFLVHWLDTMTKDNHESKRLPSRSIE